MSPLISPSPPADRAFRAFALKCLDTATDDPSRLQQALQQRYPKARVRPRRVGYVWDVYRDGY